MICPNCENKDFYNLANDYIKCKKCAKKLSLKKIEKDKLIIQKFCENRTAFEVSNELELNYKTVKDRFDVLRQKIAVYSEDIYNSSIKDNTEYEEFYYLKEREKVKKKKSLSEAVNIIGFYSNQKVYTLLMPKIGNRAFDIEDGFIQYLSWYKIHSQNAHQTQLNKFWKFLEKNLKKHKGVDEDNFFYYLKEYEFKFNYKKSEQLGLQRDMEKIRIAIDQTDTHDFERVVDTVAAARKIYIVGFRSSAFLAGYLNFYFRMIFDNVVLVTGGEAGLFDQLFRVAPEDVLITISFPRYSELAIKAVQFAKDRGATIVGLTDSEMSPIY